MTNNKRVEFKILDVGCGTRPQGDVNVDFFRYGLNPRLGVRSEFMNSKKINNFVLADAMALPYKDNSFDLVYSSHTIEHVSKPLLMLREMCRVAKKKVIVRYPHRRGSLAAAPTHVNYFDEDWFKKAAQVLHVQIRQIIASYDYPISTRIWKICPRTLFPFITASIPWKALQRFERKFFYKTFHLPCEIDVWIRKRHNPSDSEKVKFVVVYNKPRIFKSCFASSPFVSPENIIAYHNVNNEPLPKIFNQIVQKYLHENVWFAFCHQDFVLKEDLQLRLKGKEVEAIYGPIGIRPAENRLFGMIIQGDGIPIGYELKDDTLVQTLDEMGLIVNSEAFRQGLSFDEKFRFHFYGADLCLQAYELGFDVFAMQLKCKHISKGDTTSVEYLSSLKAFREKWKKYLPIATTTKLIT